MKVRCRTAGRLAAFIGIIGFITFLPVEQPSMTKTGAKRSKKPRNDKGNGSAKRGRGRPKRYISLAAAQLLTNAPEVVLQGSTSYALTTVESADLAPSVVEIASSSEEEEDDQVETKLRRDPLSLLFVPLHRGTNHIYSEENHALGVSVKSFLLKILKSEQDVFSAVHRSNSPLKLLEEANVEYASFYDGYKKILEYRWALETAGTQHNNDILESLEKDYETVMLDEHSCRERMDQAEQKLNELQKQQDHWRKVLKEYKEAHKILEHQMNSLGTQVDRQKAAKEVKEKTLDDISKATKRLEELIKS